MCAETPSYYTDNAFQILRQKRREAEERRRAAYLEKYGPTQVHGVRASWKKKSEPRHELKMKLVTLLRGRAARLCVAQGNCCYLCGDAFTKDRRPTQDHVVPRARGGKNRLNILMAHLECNWAKGERRPSGAELAYLRAVNVAVANDEVVGPRQGVQAV